MDYAKNFPSNQIVCFIFFLTGLNENSVDICLRPVMTMDV